MVIDAGLCYLERMNVSLTDELAKIVEQKVKIGMYSSASEVVREGLRLLMQRDEMRELKLQQLRNEIKKGMNDLEAGRSRDGNEVMSDFRNRLLTLKQSNV